MLVLTNNKNKTMSRVYRTYNRSIGGYTYHYDRTISDGEFQNHQKDSASGTAKIIKRYVKKSNRFKQFLIGSFYVTVVSFALVGLIFSGVFIGMQYHLFNVEGSSISRDSFFKTLPKVKVMAAAVARNANPAVSCVQQLSDGTQVPLCAWNKSVQYATIRDGLVKDSKVIDEVAQQTGVSARMIAATVVPEQLRWFTSDRETFKRIFEPLKILGVAANMTYGIGGFHFQTAQRVEQYTKDTNSPFYAGPGMVALVAYPSVENPRDTTLLARLSDSVDHYYSYLYVALFIKEITNQWASAGYDISNRPDVIITLYNIGFDRSIPKPNPQIGGATITVNGVHYTYGELGVDFYYSDELTKVFPMQY